MAKVTRPETREVSRESIDVQVGDIAFGQPVDARKVYRKRTETFRRVKLTLRDGSVREFRERFRIPVTVKV